MLDIGAVRFGEAGRQGDSAVGQVCPFLIALAVQRRELSGGELADALDDCLDHIRAGGGKAGIGSQFVDPGVDADGKDLVGGGQ